jgi:hypothetical protein
MFSFALRRLTGTNNPDARIAVYMGATIKTWAALDIPTVLKRCSDVE